MSSWCFTTIGCPENWYFNGKNILHPPIDGFHTHNMDGLYFPSTAHLWTRGVFGIDVTTFTAPVILNYLSLKSKLVWKLELICTSLWFHRSQASCKLVQIEDLLPLVLMSSWISNFKKYPKCKWSKFKDLFFAKTYMMLTPPRLRSFVTWDGARGKMGLPMIRGWGSWADFGQQREFWNAIILKLAQIFEDKTYNDEISKGGVSSRLENLDYVMLLQFPS